MKITALQGPVGKTTGSGEHPPPPAFRLPHSAGEVEPQTVSAGGAPASNPGPGQAPHPTAPHPVLTGCEHLGQR